MPGTFLLGTFLLWASVGEWDQCRRAKNLGGISGAAQGDQFVVVARRSSQAVIPYT